MKYFDLFKDVKSVNYEFQISNDSLKDEEVILARYSYEDYSGEAVVVFKRNDKLFEVHGSHCSCYGLEGQWEPAETTKEAMLMYKNWTDEERKLIEAI